MCDPVLNTKLLGHCVQDIMKCTQIESSLRYVWLNLSVYVGVHQYSINESNVSISVWLNPSDFKPK